MVGVNSDWLSKNSKTIKGSYFQSAKHDYFEYPSVQWSVSEHWGERQLVVQGLTWTVDEDFLLFKERFPS